MAFKTAADYNIVNGTFYDKRTSLVLANILDTVRRFKQTIRLYYGDTETGKDWCEENDVTGKIGRSTGRHKVPLLIAKGQDGGPHILDHCIVKVTIKDKDGVAVLWQHPKYQTPNLAIEPETDPTMLDKGYTHQVNRDGELQARFKKLAKAEKYVAVLTGKAI